MFSSHPTSADTSHVIGVFPFYGGPYNQTTKPMHNWEAVPPAFVLVCIAFDVFEVSLTDFNTR